MWGARGAARGREGPAGGGRGAREKMGTAVLASIIAPPLPGARLTNGSAPHRWQRGGQHGEALAFKPSTHVHTGQGRWCSGGGVASCALISNRLHVAVRRGTLLLCFCWNPRLARAARGSLGGVWGGVGWGGLGWGGVVWGGAGDQQLTRTHGPLPARAGVKHHEWEGCLGCRLRPGRSHKPTRIFWGGRGLPRAKLWAGRWARLSRVGSPRALPQQRRGAQRWMCCGPLPGWLYTGRTPACWPRWPPAAGAPQLAGRYLAEPAGSAASSIVPPRRLRAHARPADCLK
jgi:hypothetical protein